MQSNKVSKPMVTLSNDALHCVSGGKIQTISVNASAVNATAVNASANNVSSVAPELNCTYPSSGGNGQAEMISQFTLGDMSCLCLNQTNYRAAVVGAFFARLANITICNTDEGK